MKRLRNLKSEILLKNIFKTEKRKKTIIFSEMKIDLMKIDLNKIKY